MKPYRPWEVRHLELSEGIPALGCASEIQGLYLVLWWHALPLGQIEIPAGLLPMDASELVEQVVAALTPTARHYFDAQGREAPAGKPQDPAAFDRLWRPLDRLESLLAPSPEPALEGPVSVVVCTRDRPESLARCLRSLLDLTPLPFEILVIDNAPGSGATRELVERLPGVRYVLEPRAGLDRARNAGVREARGAFIAFVDDDVTVHPGWLARLKQGFRDPHVQAVTGLVLPAELDTEAQFIFEKHWGFNRGYRPRLFDAAYWERTRARGAPVWEIGAGANMAFRREVFERLGGFDERLDVGAAGCSGDSEFWYRILAAGGCCRYEPAAVVFHHHRRAFESLKKQLFYYMRGHVTALLIQFERHRHRGNLRRLLLSLPGYYARLIVRAARTGVTYRTRTLPSEIAGCLSGIAFYLRNSRAAVSSGRRKTEAGHDLHPCGDPTEH